MHCYQNLRDISNFNSSEIGKSSALLYYTLLYFPLLCSTLLYSILLCSTLLYFPLLRSTLLYTTLLYSALPCSFLFYSALLCTTLLYLHYSTLLCSTLPYFALLYSVLSKSKIHTYFHISTLAVLRNFTSIKCLHISLMLSSYLLK